MRNVLLPLALIAAVLAVPIVPFAILGASFEAQVQGRLDAALPRTAVAAMVVGLLASDILLPVPSSVVSTFAGNALGFWLGAAATWLGMTLGASLGFGLARSLGRPLALRLSSAEALGQIDAAGRRYGPWVLVLARPVPVLAEASVLLLGTAELPWRRFVVPVALSNAGIAMVYAALGRLVALPLALAASIALPLAVAMVARQFWPATSGTGTGRQE